MKKFLFLAIFLLNSSIFAQIPAENYPEDSASIEQKGVPKGEIMKFTFDNSKIYPGTWREYWVYVPSQYRPDKPACVYVNQDGIQWKAPTVFDNLIHQKEMPITIGVFVSPGKVRATNIETSADRLNRTFEYDGLGDAYARFILDEILPEVEKLKTSDGRQLHLSKNGNDRAIGGSSSGAICAFTAAWEKPAEFSRVFSAIGTYTNLRGGDRYLTLVHKYEPKPIRVFLQDGSNDLNNPFGDWFKANEYLERALTFAGYEVQHTWGEGGHNGKQGTAIFPQVMRYLWKDYPTPVKTGSSKNPFINDILLPNEGWELVGQGYGFTEGIAANAVGEVFFQDIPNAKTYKVGLDGKVNLLPIDSKRASGTAFTKDGTMVTITSSWGGYPVKQIISYDKDFKAKVVKDSLGGNDIVVANNGNIYLTQPDGSEKPSKLYLVRPNGEKLIVDEGIKFANGLAFSPDQTQLYVTESASHWVWIYQIQADGKLAYKQRYGWLHVPDTAENAWSDGIKCDHDGRIYVTSRLGIQVMDATGRVNAIIPVPTTGNGQSSNLCFGGTNFDLLYVSSNDKVYRRKVKVRGVNTFEAPFKPMSK
jgi:gluconolactonase